MGQKSRTSGVRRAAARWAGGIVEGVTGDARDEITFVHEGAIYIVTQDRPYPTGERIYAPTRRMDISNPGWRVND